MKSIKILLPSALTFIMFIGYNSVSAQSSMNDPFNNTILSLTEIKGMKKSVGLDYKKTLVEINHLLVDGVKADHSIDFRGKIMINLDVDASGLINTITYDQLIPEKLKHTIEKALTSVEVSPVLLNGKAKNQSFNIPVIIK